MNWLLFGIVGYVLVQFAVGLYVARFIKSEQDFLLAGRRLGLGLAAFTIFATWFGAESSVSAAGSMYARGLSGETAEPFGYALCLILMGLVFAAPLWRRGYVTIADLFRERYSPGVEKLAAVLIIPASVIWAAAQIRAFGQVLAAAGELEVTVAVTLAALVVIIYTARGGLLASAVTDIVQGSVLILGLVLLGWSVMQAAGGWHAALASIDPQKLQWTGHDDGLLATLEKWAIPIFGSVLAQELIARTLAARSAATARRAAILGGTLYLAAGLVPVFIGLVGASLLPGLEEPEQIIPRLAQLQLAGFVYVLFAGALISAILSTVDSALLSAASLLSHNVLARLVPGGLDDRARLSAARWMVVLMGLLAWFMALHAERIYDLVETASAFGSSGVFVVGCFGLFTRIGGAAAAVAALLTGIMVWITGEFVLGLSAPYLTSLAAALVAYLTATGVERRRRAAASGLPHRGVRDAESL
jgi:SSS family transporter